MLFTGMPVKLSQNPILKKWAYDYGCHPQGMATVLFLKTIAQSFEMLAASISILICYFCLPDTTNNIKSRIYQLSSFLQASHKWKSIEIIFQGSFQLSLNMGTYVHLHTHIFFSAKFYYYIKLCIHIKKFTSSFTTHVKVTTDPLLPYLLP